jgi:hypothetical protein
MRLPATLLLVFAAGCAALVSDGGEAARVSEVVAAAVTASRTPPEEQRRQLTHAQQMFAAGQDDMNRARLAALLAMLPAPLRDEARAAALLEPLAARRPETPLVQFASLLAAGVAERQKLARDLRAAEKREEGAEERAATLQKQVEALKSIERGILEREERRRTIKR